MHGAITALASVTAPLCAAHGCLVPAGDRKDTVIAGLIAGTRRRCRFVEGHLRFLGALDWRRVLAAGAHDPESGERKPLCLTCGDVEYRFAHPDAVVQQVYVSFDGVVTGCVNATDSLGRALNLAFRLGISEPQASLGRLAQVTHERSPLGAACRAAADADWLPALRRLRGRCQHADLDHVLERPRGPLGEHPEPEVPVDCCPSGATAPSSMIGYAAGAGVWLAQALEQICAVVQQHGAAATKAVAAAGQR